jgi:HEAT repeat protein
MRRATWLIVGGFLVSAVASAQEPLAPEGAIEQLIEEERYRSAVEDALEYAHQPGIAGAQRVEVALEAIGDLIEAGPGVVPYLANELDQAEPVTFFFCAFALSHFKTEESEAAIRRALERANQDGSDFANIRKAWCGYALGFMGVVEALDLVNDGQHAAGRYQIHARMSVIEAVALLNATSSVPLLLRQLDDYAEIDSLWAMRVFTLQALGLLGDRATVPRILKVLEEERPDRYPEALEALGRIGDDRAIPAVISALDNPDPRIHQRAAKALDWLRTPARLEWAADRLNTETNPYVRRTLYRLIADVGGTSQLATLEKYWGRPDSIDRQYLVQAVASLKSPKTLDLLRAALNDPNERVAYRGTVALADLGTPEALALLHEAVRSRSLPRSRSAVNELLRIGDRSAAPSIAERLFGVELSANVLDPRRRERAELMAEGRKTETS